MKKEYKVTNDKGETLAPFANKKKAGIYAKSKAIELVDSVSVDLWDDTCEIYQYMETVASFDPMGKLLT